MYPNAVNKLYGVWSKWKTEQQYVNDSSPSTSIGTYP